MKTTPDLTRFVGDSQTVFAGVLEKPEHLVRMLTAKNGKKDYSECDCEGRADCQCEKFKSLRPFSLHIKALPDDLDGLEDDIGSAVDEILDEQVAEVLSELRSAKQLSPRLIRSIESMLKANRWDDRLLSVMKPYLETAIKQGVSFGTDTISQMAAQSGVPSSLFTPKKETLARYIETQSTRLAASSSKAVNETTTVRIKDLLGRSMEGAYTIDEVADAVQEWAGVNKDEERGQRRRAMTIARTEAMRAYASAEAEAWKDTGIVEGKEWLLAPSSCEFCEAAAEELKGKVIPLDEPFFEYGTVLVGAETGKSMVLDYEDVMTPPLHPNCRCSMQPVLISDFADLIEEGVEAVRNQKPRDVKPPEEAT